MVLNGYELGGGSIRIHDVSYKKKCSKFLDLLKNKPQEQFGFLLDALNMVHHLMAVLH
ncbi:amino acid--tRNA ligase-related protein [Staphylococcus aureus]|uniref:amino acid--tRNA ligase-related protein n=1 Tax=Staphylococcus aureus TaxID=1280 RepID=UPI003B20EE50